MGRSVGGIWQADHGGLHGAEDTSILRHRGRWYPPPMQLRTGGKLLVAVTSLAAALLGGAALVQRKTADITASERDHLLHLIARTQTEMAVSQLNDASSHATRLTHALIEATDRRTPASSAEALERSARRWLRADPSLREVALIGHPTGDRRWNRSEGSRGSPTLPPAARGGLKDAGEGALSFVPTTLPSAPQVTVEERGLHTFVDGSERKPMLQIRARVQPADPSAAPWFITTQLDLSPALRSLTRGPGHRFGHLALVTAGEEIAWGPTQRYDDGGSGWVELDDAHIVEACRAWRDAGAAPDRFTPFHHNSHVFAVRGRTLHTFDPSPTTVCIVLPRRGYSGLF